MSHCFDYGPPGPLGDVKVLSNDTRAFVKQHIHDAAAAEGIPYDIFLAQMLHESAHTLNPVILGDADIGGTILGRYASVGFGQVNVTAHPDYDWQRALGIGGKAPDVEYEATYSAQFLKRLYNSWGTWEMALHRYNGEGPGAIQYSKTVMAMAEALKAEGLA